MKTCCNNDCDQGRKCPSRQACELPITMEDDAFDYSWVMEMARDLLMVVGMFALIGLVCAVAYWGRA